MDILLLITKFRQQKDIPFNSNKRYVFCKYILLFQSFALIHYIFGYGKIAINKSIYVSKKTVQTFWEPKFLVTDKTPSIVCAFRKLQNNVFIIRQNIEQ